MTMKWEKMWRDSLWVRAKEGLMSASVCHKTDDGTRWWKERKWNAKKKWGKAKLTGIWWVDETSMLPFPSGRVFHTFDAQRWSRYEKHRKKLFSEKNFFQKSSFFPTALSPPPQLIQQCSIHCVLSDLVCRSIGFSGIADKTKGRKEEQESFYN